MIEGQKRRIVVVVGSGFSSALTSGSTPLVGNQQMPTLAGLAKAMLTHLTDVANELPFSKEVIDATRRVLDQNQSMEPKQRFDFQQLLSLISIKSTFGSSYDLDQFGSQLMAQVLRCLIYLIPSLFAKYLSIDGKLVKNRNLFYAVKDEVRVKAIQTAIRRLVDQHDVTFITFNYDGLIEAFLDCDLGVAGRGVTPVFRYFPEISHGVRMIMPEHIFGSRDTRDLSKWCHLPQVLKPHGSMHFYRVKDEMRDLTNSPQIAALHPRFDIGFDPKTMARDIPAVEFWQYTDPIPFIIPPVLNKDAFLALDYVKTIFGLAESALVQADALVVLGFSIPRSDLHVNALLEYVAEQRKQSPAVGLVYKESESDETLMNWTRVFGQSAVRVIEKEGMPTRTAEEIAATWSVILDFAQSPQTR